MKTTTEDDPMIFSPLGEHDLPGVAWHRRLKTDVTLVTGYCLFGLWLCWDTGFAPWHWQFWLCFGPLFVAVEMALRAVAANEDCETES